MKKLIFILSSALAIFGIALPAIAAPRVFVSGFGNNANTGTLTSPVRQIQKAVSMADPNGEVIILDAANYAPFTVNKPVTVVATGVQGEIEVTSGNGITINVGVSDSVVLRGLTINGLGGTNGINFTAGAALHVENCVISGFTAAGGAGINSSAALGQLFVKDTISRQNLSGIYATAGKLSIDQARLESNSVGLNLNVSSPAKASIRNSVASGNSQGIYAASSGAELNVEGCLVANNSDQGFGVAQAQSSASRIRP